MSDVGQIQYPLLPQLREARDLLRAMGREFSGFPPRLDELHDRMAEGHLRLAVLGQFKRGKSTLLNALLGEELLPTGVLPLTAIPTVLRYGPERRARVTLIDGTGEDCFGSPQAIEALLKRYVSEQANPANRLGVARVEVEAPSSFLAKGIEVLDTPGIGSTLLHNTRTAREVLRACDVALFILSPDPPITEVEVEYLKTITAAIPRVIFVLTKGDQLDAPARAELLAFLDDVIKKQAGYPDPDRIFVVSAHQAMMARASSDLALREESGLDALESYLAKFLITEKQAVLQQAIRGKTARLLAEAMFTLDVLRKALDLPREELERRRLRLEQGLAKVERERRYFHDRLAGDRQRLLSELDEEADRLGKELHQRLIATAKNTWPNGRSPHRVRDLVAQVKSHLARELELALPQMTRQVSETMTRRLREVEDAHCRHVAELLDGIRRTAADLFEVPYLGAVALQAMETMREPRVVSQRWITSFTEEAALRMTRLLPAPWRARRLEAWVARELEYLAARNLEEVRWPTRLAIEDALRVFQTLIDSEVDSILEAIRKTVHAAISRQSEREARQGTEMQRLESFHSRLEHLILAISAREARSLAGGPV